MSPARLFTGDDGNAVNENLESTPLAEDGFLYVIDLWGVVYKIDARAGDVGRIMWRMDPKQEKAPDANRGVALWEAYPVDSGPSICGRRGT
jgi:glucose dehydrogenase